MKVFALLIGLFFCGQVLAQDQYNVDSTLYFTSRGQIARALPFAKRSVERAQNISNNDSTYMDAVARLASIYYGMVKPDSALVYYNKACEAAKRRFGVTSVQYGNLLVSAALMYADLGQYQEAEQKFQNATAILNRSENSYKKAYIIRCLTEHATLCITKGDLNRAEELCLNAREIALQKPADMNGYTSALEKLGRLYGKMGFYAKQDSILIQIYELYKQKYEEGYHKYVHALAGMAAVYKRKQDWQKADSMYRRALAITEQNTGKNAPANIYLLRHIGIVNTEMRKYEVAETYLKEAMEIVNSNGGEASPLYTMCSNNLARVYASMGKKEQAEELFKKSISIYQKLGLTLHSARLSLLYDMAELLCADEPDRAAIYLKEAMDTEKKLLLEKLDFLSEPELLTYLKGIKDVADIPFRFLQRHKNQEIAGAAYNSRLLMAGIGLQNTRTLYQNMASSKNKELGMIWKNYQQQKSFYTTLLLTPVPNRNTNTDSVAELLNKQEKEILRKSAAYRNMKEQLNITWQDVQKHLKPGETAIEFVRVNGQSYTYTETKAADTFYYAALVLRAQDAEPRFVVLCNEKQLIAALKKFPYKSAAANNRGQNNTSYTQPATNVLYKLVWQQLEPYLTNTQTVYFSPDGILHRIAFAAITYKKSLLLCDQYNLVQLTSTRQIALQKAKAAAPVSIAMFGGINYNSSSADKSIASSGTHYTYVYGNSRSADVDSFRFLPNTVTEINAIQTDAEASQKLSVIFTGDNATEAAFRNLGGDYSPEVIHFATHGFTLPDTAKSNNTATPFKASDNPLIRCGLVMAGGNKGWKGNAEPDEDDGILTGLEISSVQLPNTQLAVLSACETGLGKIEGSEGVFGLQRAFKLAGVNYVIASLWQLPDKETAEFMKTFYAHWLGGKTIRQAFFTTQKLMRKKHAPYYWAGFTLVQ